MLGVSVSGPTIGGDVLEVCERLNALPDTLVFDLVLRTAYPKC